MKQGNASNLVGQKIGNYSFLQLISNFGGYKIYEVWDEKNEKAIVCKAYPSSLLLNNNYKKIIQRQINTMKACKDNRNIIEFIDTCKTDNFVLIFMERCNEGSLDEYLKKTMNLTESIAIQYLKQIINGFDALHQQNVVFPIFTLSKVLLHNGQVKINNLNLLQQIDSVYTNESFITTAPEILSGEAFELKADVWTMGVIFYQMLFGKYPFQAKDEQQLIQVYKKKPVLQKVNISPNVKKILQQCLRFDKFARITWAQLKQNILATQKEKLLLDAKPDQKYGEIPIDNQLLSEKKQIKRQDNNSQNMKQKAPLPKVDLNYSCLKQDYQKLKKVQQELRQKYQQKQKQKAKLIQQLREKDELIKKMALQKLNLEKQITLQKEAYSKKEKQQSLCSQELFQMKHNKMSESILNETEKHKSSKEYFEQRILLLKEQVQNLQHSLCTTKLEKERNHKFKEQCQKLTQQKQLLQTKIKHLQSEKIQYIEKEKYREKETIQLEKNLSQDQQLIQKTKRSINKLLNKTSQLQKIETQVQIYKKQNEELKNSIIVLEQKCSKIDCDKKKKGSSFWGGIFQKF